MIECTLLLKLSVFQFFNSETVFFSCISIVTELPIISVVEQM
jgi:hypothetical protein